MTRGQSCDPMLEKMARFCQKHALLAPHDHIVVGVSGGADSLCLLHLLLRLKSNLALTLTVAHLNHQLRGFASQTDEAFVKSIASQWQLPIFAQSQDVAKIASKQKQSLEEAARQTRYAFLNQVAATVGASKVAVGHQADDQAETVLMHFLRGTGLSGLRGMLPLSPLPNQLDSETASDQPSPQLIRPLLDISRLEIEAYCQKHGLSARHDASNDETIFLRNRLRHDLLPYLESYNPNLRGLLQQTATIVAAEIELLEPQKKQAWQSILISETDDQLTLDLSAWLQLPLALKRATLRRTIKQLLGDLRNIGFEHIETTIQTIEQGHTSTQACLPRQLVISRTYDTLIAAKMGANPPPISTPYLTESSTLVVPIPGLITLPGTAWQLMTNLLPADELNPKQLKQAEAWEAYLDAARVGQTLKLRPRRPGDRLQPLGLGGRQQKVKTLMINAKIPANQRDHIPLLVSNNQVLWVCGYRVAEVAAIRLTTEQVVYFKFVKREYTVN